VSSTEPTNTLASYSEYILVAIGIYVSSKVPLLAVLGSSIASVKSLL